MYADHQLKRDLKFRTKFFSDKKCDLQKTGTLRYMCTGMQITESTIGTSKQVINCINQQQQQH